jgi:hypothetical protein
MRRAGFSIWIVWRRWVRIPMYHIPGGCIDGVVVEGHEMVAILGFTVVFLGPVLAHLRYNMRNIVGCLFAMQPYDLE